jgi:ABC-type lipoprotein release transport system permease subunit
MSDAVLVAVLSLIGTLGGSLLGILAANKLTNYRIEQLEKKVQAHNNFDTRLHTLDTDMEVVHEQIKVINHRIDDLEKPA